MRISSIATSDVELEVFESGSPRGTPLLLLHGLSDSALSMHHFMRLMPPDIRCIAVTQRGHGDSGKPAGPYTADAMAADAVAVMDGLGVARAVVFGHSMGSIVAQRLALQHPDRVAGLVLVGAFPGLKGNPAVEGFYEAAVADLVDPIDPAFAREFQVSALADPVSEAFLDMVTRESCKLPAVAWKQILRDLMAYDSSPDLAQIRGPALLLWGDRDEFVGFGDQQRLLSGIAGSSLEIFEGAGHSPHWEQPERAAQLTLDYVRRCFAPRVLPQLAGDRPFLTDGGIETSLIFDDGLDLPHFAAFTLLRDADGREALRRYYRRYLAIAAESGAGFVLEAPTWRASPDWAQRLGLSMEEMDACNRDAITLLQDLRAEWLDRVPALVVSGCVGPRGDGYVAGELMSAEAAEAYHSVQVRSFREAGADMVCAITMTNVPEAVGVVRAARAAGLACAVSFTVETDGRLPGGEGLGEAIEAVDALTDEGAAYFMVNCAHPSHFEATLDVEASWVSRVRGVRANASTRSHAELNEAPDLDSGDPDAFGREHGELLRRHPQLRVLGGCCGTDERHLRAISRACVAVEPA